MNRVGKPAHIALLPFAQHQLELEGLRPLRLFLVQPIFIRWDALSAPAINRRRPPRSSDKRK
jgi:hypothetical protein